MQDKTFDLNQNPMGKGGNEEKCLSRPKKCFFFRGRQDLKFANTCSAGEPTHFMFYGCIFVCIVDSPCAYFVPCFVALTASEARSAFRWDQATYNPPASINPCHWLAFWATVAAVGCGMFVFAA